MTSPAGQTKVTGVPPPYTITCEQPLPSSSSYQPPPPTYNQTMTPNASAGWNVGPPVTSPQTASVVYVSHAPNVIVDHSGLISTCALRCPSCREIVRTRVRFRPGCQTHLWAGILCLFGCWPCVCLPYCTPSCQDQDHYCYNCGAYIASAQ